MAFERPTFSDLLQRVENDLSDRLGLGPLLQRSVLIVLARVIAGEDHLLHGHLAFLADQVVPDRADSSNLERWANLFGVFRKAATFSAGAATFTGTAATLIPTGTQLRRVDGRTFETTADGTVGGGGSISVAVQAVLAGELGDTAATTGLSLVSPIAGIDSTATVDSGGLTGGSDAETDEDLLERFRTRVQSSESIGTASAYELFALEVAEVTRAWTLPMHFGDGTVGLTFVVDDDPAGPIPSSAKVAEVQAYLDDGRTPVTATLTVFAPATQALDPEIQLLPDSAAIRESVEAALEDLILEEAEPGGTLPISKIREAISTAAGEEDHVLVSPVANVTTPGGTILVLGTITWS